MLRLSLRMAVASALLACSGDAEITPPTSSATGAGGGASTASVTGSGATAGSTSGAGGGGVTPCEAGGAAIEALPACGADPGSSVDVERGCEPVVDGALHAGEWADATCFDVPAMGGGSDMTVVVKYAGDAVYMATSGLPTCGCAMHFYFDPDDGGAAGGEIVISVFDDPFGVNGDMSAFELQAGMLAPAVAPPGLVTRCPGDQPTPIRYEWKIPFDMIGRTAGAAGAYRMAIVHASAHWPATLGFSPQGIPDDPGSYGRFASPTWD